MGHAEWVDAGNGMVKEVLVVSVVTAHRERFSCFFSARQQLWDEVGGSHLAGPHNTWTPQANAGVVRVR